MNTAFHFVRNAGSERRRGPQGLLRETLDLQQRATGPQLIHHHVDFLAF